MNTQTQSAATAASIEINNGIILSDMVKMAGVLGFEPRSSRFGDVYFAVKLKPYRAEGISPGSQEEGEAGFLRLVSAERSRTAQFHV